MIRSQRLKKTTVHLRKRGMVEESMRLIFLTNHWPYPPGETFLTSDLEAISKHIDEIIVIPVGLSFEESSEPYSISSNINVNIKPVTMAVKRWKSWSKFRRAIKGLTRLDILRSERSRKPSLPTFKTSRPGRPRFFERTRSR